MFVFVVELESRHLKWYSKSTKCYLLFKESFVFSFFLKLADDRMALVSGISLDPEAAIGVTKKLPPKWIEGVDEVKQSLLNPDQKYTDSSQ